MTTCCPSESESFWPSTRASVSVLPPGAKGTTKRTGLVGYACPEADADAIDMAAAKSRPITLRFIGLLPIKGVAHASRLQPSRS
jgi:hypothetical protein